METRQLRYFVAVAEERHFGRAALRLHMAQPPLSHQIKQLEEQLGTQLLVRTTRKVELTPAGQLLLVRARGLLAEIDAAGAGREAGGPGRQRRAAGRRGWIRHLPVDAAHRRDGRKARCRD